MCRFLSYLTFANSLLQPSRYFWLSAVLLLLGDALLSTFAAREHAQIRAKNLLLVPVLILGGPIN